MPTINLTDEQYEQFRKVFLAPKQWEPAPGEWYVGVIGRVELDNYGSSDESRQYGIERVHEADAQQLADLMRRTARLSAWVDEHGGYEWENGKENFYVCRDNGTWESTWARQIYTPTTVYMNQAQAEKLTRLLNEGVVTL